MLRKIEIFGIPMSAYFILGNEFCERFCFYGMKAILPIYLTAWLQFSQNQSVSIIHGFVFGAYFFSLLGAILADGVLGRFWTILVFSMIYFCGSLMVSITSIPGVTGVPAHWWGLAVGLLILTVGTGGIKPCVSTFGGDQLLRNHTSKVETFFNFFYTAVNVGSLCSIFLTPILRNIHCLGQDSCYPLAFGVPAVLMFLAVVIFLLGKPLYFIDNTKGNLVNVFKAIFHALKKKANGEDHWIMRASDRFDQKFLADIKQCISAIRAFLPVIFFNAVYEQQGSRWTFQAIQMSPKIFKWKIRPEQMGIVNSFLVIALVPFFNFAVFPLLRKIGFKCRPLSRAVSGFVLGIVSFLVAALVQYLIDSRGVFVTNPENPMTQICTKNCVNVMWQVPQYFLITVAEILVNITILEFAYSQSPSSLKSVTQACTLLTNAGANLLVLLVNFINLPDRLGLKYPATVNYLMWATILLLGTVYLVYELKRFKYHQPHMIETVTVDVVKSTDDLIKK